MSCLRRTHVDHRARAPGRGVLPASLHRPLVRTVVAPPLVRFPRAQWVETTLPRRTVPVLPPTTTDGDGSVSAYPVRRLAEVRRWPCAAASGSYMVRNCGLARSRQSASLRMNPVNRPVPFVPQHGGNRMNTEQVSANDVLTDETATANAAQITRLSAEAALMAQHWVDRRSPPRRDRQTAAGQAPPAPADPPSNQRTYITCDLVNPPIGITSKPEFCRWIEAQDFHVHFHSRSACHQDGQLLTLYLACRAYGPIGIEVQVAGFIVTIEAEFSNTEGDTLAARVL